MEITKQRIWLMIQIAMAAYLIISSCMDPPKPSASGEVEAPRINYGKSLSRFQKPVSNPFIKTVSFLPQQFIFY